MCFAHLFDQYHGERASKLARHGGRDYLERPPLPLGFQGPASQEHWLDEDTSLKEDETCRVETEPVREEWDQ